MRGDPTGWRALAVDGAPGLAGVWMQDANSTFLVGAHGFTMHTDNMTRHRPAAPDTPDATQRGVVLVRGATSARFALDGRPYTATGRVRPTLGAGVGGAQ
ncbi:MAG: hypothetical protein U0324_16785 [Polyangiales bacterium]